LVWLLLVAVSLAQAARGNEGTDWQPLHRALHLPTLAAGQRCPLSRPAPEITSEKYGVSGAIGRGPVYAVGAANLDVRYRPEDWGQGPWGGQKVFWFVRPDYTGPVLIRGRRLGGWQWMRFDRGARPSAEIRVEPGETVTWGGQAPGSRGRPSYVRVRSPGCYAAQIDGTTFSEVVVFGVSGLR
jgi:hypothetical protein